MFHPDEPSARSPRDGNVAQVLLKSGASPRDSVALYGVPVTIERYLRLVASLMAPVLAALTRW